jgi:hypothetical protein
MTNYNQNVFYFNLIETKQIKDDIESINNFKWDKKIIVINTTNYDIEFANNSNRLYLKSIKNYSTDKFKKIFHLNFMNWYYDGKIVEIVNFN